MHRASLRTRIFAGFAAFCLLAISAGTAWAVATDHLNREIMPAGTVIQGIDVSGMTRAEAARAIERQIVTPLTAPVSIIHESQEFELPASEMISVDVDGMIEEAFAPKATATLPVRVYHDVTDTEPGVTVTARLTVDAERLSDWVRQVAAQVERPAVDATMSVTNRELETLPSQRGVVVDVEKTTDALAEALELGVKRLDLPVGYIEPELTEEDLGTVILVRRMDRKLFLYESGSVVKEYSVAIGTPGHPTPLGEWKITLKRYMPSWGNPGSAWAADMPAYIPPGPSNPLGTRALNLNAPGIRIHGTSADYSIGTAASHGCVRMHRWDIEELYELVDVGTPVIIID
ncbi:MAG: hypothetical protein Kow0067_15890 [Coriobacteriia bacterium]